MVCDCHHYELELAVMKFSPLLSLLAVFILVIVGCGDAATTKDSAAIKDAATTFDPELKSTLTETIPSTILPEINFESGSKYRIFSDNTVDQAKGDQTY